MHGPATAHVPFSRRHPRAYLAMWGLGVALVLFAFTGHLF